MRGLRASLFEMGAVCEEQIAEDGSWLLHIDLPLSQVERLAGQSGALGALARERLLGDSPAVAESQVLSA